MLSEQLKDSATASAIAAWDASVIEEAKFELGETTLVVAAEKIVALCRFLKEDQKFIRLSGVTAVDWYPMEPRFEVV
ncbi:MAG: NADH-quinone oxidoreductase subunit C, partial [Bryobacteraceae bacterium]|nr:NADH-quinone oxidoreductase subunit C [Bryobacteraceae bacterium]